MQRRKFVSLLGGAAAWPLVARARQPAVLETDGRLRRIGVLGNTPPSEPAIRPLWNAFVEGLREHGWVESRNLLIEARWVAGKTERLAEFAADLVARNVEVIVTLAGTQSTQLAKQATSTIPIVFQAVSNPIEAGFAASLASPGGNITGVATQLGDIAEKGVELLKEVIPDVRHLGLMWEPANFSSLQGYRELPAVAAKFGVTVVSFPLVVEEDVERAFATLAQAPLQALLVHATPIAGRMRKQIAALAVAQRLPTISGQSVLVREGLLMSYGPDFATQWRRTAYYVDRLLRGAKAAELPIEQPTKFELVINAKTAKALGITISPTLLARADEVIE